MGSFSRKFRRRQQRNAVADQREYVRQQVEVQMRAMPPGTTTYSIDFNLLTGEVNLAPAPVPPPDDFTPPDDCTPPAEPGTVIGAEDAHGNLVYRRYTPEDMALMAPSYGLDRELDPDQGLYEQLTPAEYAAWKARADAVTARAAIVPPDDPSLSALEARVRARYNKDAS